MKSNGRSVPSAVYIAIEPLHNQDLRLILSASGNLQIEAQTSANAGVWAASPSERYPTPYFAGLMLDREPSTAAQPLTIPGSATTAWRGSRKGISWTGTQFKLMGMDATDSFWPGRPVILPYVDSLDEIVVRSGFAQTTSTAYGSETGFFPSEPAASWHGDLSTSDTAPRSRRAICRRPPSAAPSSRPSGFAGSPEMPRKPAGLSRNGPICLFPSLEGSSQTFPSPVPETISVAECSSATRACGSSGAARHSTILQRLARASLELGHARRTRSARCPAHGPSFVSPYGFQN